VPRTVWIVSSGRTGTQFLARYFDENFARVIARHEPSPRIRTRLVANAYAQGACSHDRVASLLRRKRRDIDGLASDLYIESNPFLWGAIRVLDEVFDSPLVVHVVRDPREQVRSSLNHGTSRGLKSIANRWLPYWYPSTPEAGAGWVERASGMWAAVNLFLAEAGAACSNYRLVRYEDLFDESHSGLRELCGWIGVEFRGAGSAVEPAQRINTGARRVIGGWADWSDAQCAAVHRITGPLMARYGYGVEPAWRSRVGAGA